VLRLKTDTEPDSELSLVSDRPIVLYDGVCGFCNRSIQFVLRRDHRGIFRFASLQSIFAEEILTRHGINPSSLDTFYVAVRHNEADEKLIARSDAAMYLLRRLGGIWRAAAWLLRILPRSLREWGYGAVAKNRYRIFGRYDSCPLPSAETRARFLDI
jgi:predicted DCC family thiol-disulfide oxidoreductase YuxK